MVANSPRPPILRGQLVRIRTESEISATLDADGKLEGMPFMPEMARHCGQVFRVYRHAVKTCVEGHSLRRLDAVVHLEGLRCAGEFHDGCQRNCLFFWKEAWLDPLVEPNAQGPGPTGPAPLAEGPPEWARRLPTKREDRYICQSTELLGATRPLSRWNVTHLLLEIHLGELPIGQFFKITLSTLWDRLRGVLGLRRAGTLSGAEKPASRGELDLRAGEWVRVKSVDEIRRTLDPDGKNLGLSFEPDMVEFTGGRFQVEFPIRKIILEQTGRMIPLEHTVALKGIACGGTCTKNCPRNNTLYWREIWLERIEKAP